MFMNCDIFFFFKQTSEVDVRISDWSSDVCSSDLFSDDPGSKNSGGDLGFQPPGVFVPEFQSRLDQLKPNEISEPFRTQFGWHVAQLLDRRERDVTDEQKRTRARTAIGTHGRRPGGGKGCLEV